jgi:hypothetical protein
MQQGGRGPVELGQLLDFGGILAPLAGLVRALRGDLHIKGAG